VATLLVGAPRVKTVVTSRTALRIAAEREYPLQPLTTDAAVALFVDRARAVRPAFDPTGAQAEVVREICARLDHLPLAVELAAAGVKLLSVEQVRRRLADRLGLPSGVRRDVPARQQTLRDTIAWSFDLLTPDASELLCRASVFAGGFTLEAIEGVSGDDADPVAGVATLVDQSLLRHDLGAGRFSMLETIREFALEEARSRGLLAEANRRHAEFFAALAARAEAGPRGAHLAERVRIDDDLPNLRAALAWALEAEPPHGELAAPVAVALGQHWYTHGRAVEGAAWLRRVHALEDVPPGLRAQVAQRLGVLLDQQADKAGATEVLAQALDLFRQVGDRAGQARALNSLGSASRTVGSTARARELFEQSLRLRVEIGDEAGVSVTTFNLGQLAMDDGDPEQARLLFERSRDLDVSLGDEWGAMIGALGIAAAAVAQGDLETVPGRLAEAVRFFLDSEDEDHLAEALSVCAAEACARRLFERSGRLLGAVEGLWEGLGFSLSPVDDVYVERCRTAVRAAMGEPAFSRTLAEGRAMTPDQAVAFAADAYAVPVTDPGAGVRP
jgi:predicted ATPase